MRLVSIIKVQNRLSPLLNNTYDNAQQIDVEMRHVAWLLTEAAMKSLPQTLKWKSQGSYRDNMLSCLCALSINTPRT